MVYTKEKETKKINVNVTLVSYVKYKDIHRIEDIKK